MGGLGNQLFQYATARKISHLQKTILKHDLKNFKKNTKK